MPLTDVIVRGARPRARRYKLFDAGGLYLIVTPGGGKWWRWKYSGQGSEKGLSLGTYPRVGLKDARRLRDEARALLARGVNPSEARKAAKAPRKPAEAESFEAVAREWLGKF